MSFWWQEDNELEMANSLTELIEQLREDHQGRRMLNLDMLRMYTQRDYEMLGRVDPGGRIGRGSDD